MGHIEFMFLLEKAIIIGFAELFLERSIKLSKGIVLEHANCNATP